MTARPAACMLCTAAAAIALMLVGCEEFLLGEVLTDGDAVAPIPGGVITVTRIEFETFELEWPPAVDNWTATEDLEYRVYGSQYDQLDSYIEAETRAEFRSEWVRAKTTLTSAELPPVTDGRTYYANVFVRDEEGNIAPYGTISDTTPPRYDIIVAGAGSTPYIVENLSEFGESIAFDTGTPAALTMFAVGADALEVIDVNLDGRPDVVHGRAGAPTHIYRNSGDWDSEPTRGFDRVQQLASSFDEATSVAIGDFFRSSSGGYPDLVVFDSGAGRVVAVQNVFGVLGSATIVPTDPDWTGSDDITHLAAGDVNADGFPDLMFGRGAVGGANDIAFLNTGNETFRSGSETAADAASLGTSVQTREIVAVDFTGDDILDLFIAAEGSDDVLFVGSGDGTFTRHTSAVITGGASSSAAAGDLDGDGDADLVRGLSVGGAVEVYLNNGIDESPTVGSWVAIATALPSSPGNAIDVELVDLNGDGDRDLIAVSSTTDDVMVWSNDGATADTDVTFTAVAGFPVGLAPLDPRIVRVAPFFQ